MTVWSAGSAPPTWYEKFQAVGAQIEQRLCTYIERDLHILRGIRSAG